jgi:hypothetical protein
MRIFTKRFLQTSLSDQRAIVNSRIRDLQNASDFYKWDHNLKRELSRLRAKAVAHGILSDESTETLPTPADSILRRSDR